MKKLIISLFIIFAVMYTTDLDCTGSNGEYVCGTSDTLGGTYLEMPKNCEAQEVFNGGLYETQYVIKCYSEYEFKTLRR